MENLHIKLNRSVTGMCKECGDNFGFLSDPGYYVFSVFISVHVCVFVAIKIKFKPNGLQLYHIQSINFV